MRRIMSVFEVLVITILFLHTSCGNEEDDSDKNNMTPLPHCASTYTFKVVNNDDVMFKMTEHIQDVMSCTIISPDDKTWTFTSQNATNNLATDKVHFWGNFSTGECGAKIRNISNSGDWYLLASQQDGDSICQYATINQVYVYIENLNIKVAAGSVLSWSSKTDDISYCDVMKPNGERYDEVFTGNCDVEISAASFQDSGEWKVMLGYKGKVNEEQQTVNVEVEDIQVDVGIMESSTNTGNTNLYCNLISSFYKLTTCRFTRPGDMVDFRMTQGVGEGNYLYYGKGIDENECGITILQPTDIDYGSWMCTLVFTSDMSNDGGNDIITSFITFGEQIAMAGRELQSTEDEVFNFWAGSNSSVSCNLSTALRSCSLVLPTGESFIGEKNYFGSGLCKSPILQMSEKHNGTWQCILTQNTADQDIIQNMTVIVKSIPFSAIHPTITVNLEQRAIMLCRTLETRTSLTYCAFKNPDGQLISVTSNSNGQYQYYGNGMKYGECGLEIKQVRPSDEGNWTCMAGKNDWTMKDTISIKLTDNTTKVFPSNLVTNEGNTIILQLEEKLPGLKACNFIIQDDTKWSLNPTESVTVSGNMQAIYWGTGFEVGDCGVKLTGLTETQDQEKWTLEAIDEQNNVVNGASFVSVSATTEPDIKEKTVKVSLGNEAALTCGEQIQSKDYCVFMAPNEDNSTIVSSCSLILSPVKKEHIGNWTCYIGLSYSTNETMEAITVTLADTRLSVSVSGEAVLGGPFTAVCTIPYSLQFCRFLPANGSSAIVLTSGVVTGNYSYSGAGLQFGECGLHISRVSVSDFGSWKCFVGWEEGEVINYAASIVTIGTISEGTKMSNEDEIIVTTNSHLEVQCYASGRLDYCWFRHPNGSELVPEQLVGLLSLGECSISINDAKESDSGIWECHVGEEDSKSGETVLKRTVIVSATQLLAKQSDEKVSIGATKKLKCQSVPPGSALDYCRFVRPDGINIPSVPGIQFQHYEYYGEGVDKGVCGLQIKGVQDVDVGQWTCAARLLGANYEATSQLHIDVFETSIAAISGIAAAIALFIIFVAIGTVMVIKKRHKSRFQQGIWMSQLAESISQSDASSTNSQDILPN